MIGRIFPRPRDRATARPLRNLIGEQRGAALIEFGLVGPLLAFTIMILVDGSLGMAEKAKLERAATGAVEKVTAVRSSDDTFAAIRQEAARASGRPLTAVTLEKYLECRSATATVRKTTWPGACNDGEEIARYLKVSITNSYSPLFASDTLARFYGGTGLGNGVLLTGDALVRLQ